MIWVENFLGTHVSFFNFLAIRLISRRVNAGHRPYDIPNVAQFGDNDLLQAPSTIHPYALDYYLRSSVFLLTVVVCSIFVGASEARVQRRWQDKSCFQFFNQANDPCINFYHLCSFIDSRGKLIILWVKTKCET